MGFIVYEKGSAPVKSVPTLTIQRKGLMSLNRAAWGLIGEAEAVELLYDVDRRIIALRPATLANQNAYPVRPQSSAPNRGPLLVAANMFTRFIDLDTSEARRWIPALLDGMLTIDLKTPGARAVSNRARAAEREAVEP